MLAVLSRHASCKLLSNQPTPHCSTRCALVDSAPSPSRLPFLVPFDALNVSVAAAPSPLPPSPPVLPPSLSIHPGFRVRAPAGTMMAGGRLLKEHREMQKEARAAGANAEIVLAPEDGNLSHWVGHVRGPVDTPYEVRYWFPMYVSLFFFQSHLLEVSRRVRDAGGGRRSPRW